MNKGYSLTTLRRKADKAGYIIRRGSLCFTNGKVYREPDGAKNKGYMIIDFDSNVVVGGCSDVFMYTWTLEDVEDFLQGVFANNGLTW